MQDSKHTSQSFSGGGRLCRGSGWRATPAHATSKEIIELQTQVQQLLDMVQRLQSTLDTRFGVLQHLAEQTADHANQMTATVNALQQKINAQNEALGGKLDTVSGQVQSLNDSVDELKSRIAKLDKIDPGSADAVAEHSEPATGPAARTPAPGAPAAPGADKRAASSAGTAGAPGRQPPRNAGMRRRRRSKETFQAGVRDYNAGRYPTGRRRISGRASLLSAGRSGRHRAVLPGRDRLPAAALRRRGQRLQRRAGRLQPATPRLPPRNCTKGLRCWRRTRSDAGIHELRLLIQRHPQTPEAATARTKLNSLGVHVVTTK